MSKRKKIVVSSIITATVILIAVVAGNLFWRVGRPAIQMGRDADKLRVRLLCETDHQALLRAGRKLLQQAASGELNRGVYSARELLGFPEPIPTLKANHLTIEENLIKIEMMYSGWLPLGVYVYSEDYPKRVPPFRYGDRKLLDGLWYYDDLYRTDPNAYDKKIDALLEEYSRE